jgi:hypothetical protein
MVSIKSPPSNSTNQSIRKQIDRRLPINLEGHIATATKSHAETTSMRLQICDDIEQVTKQIYPTHTAIFSRLKKYDPDLSFQGYPKHYPVQVLEGQGATPFNNVFLSVPTSPHPEDQLGLEFIDAWASIATQIIFPVLKTVFDRESIQLIFQEIDPAILGILIYWTALAHEWGHMVGPYRVLPTTPDFHKLIPLFQGMLGETAANATAALLTPEHPEIALWLLVFHLGYTGRKGYRTDPLKGLINSDNDTFAAVLLYQRMISDQAIEITSEHKLHLNIEQLLPCYLNLRTAIDNLAAWSFSLPESRCNQAFQNWLEDQIPYDPYNHFFIFPQSLRRIYGQVQMIPEQPHHQPLLPFLID